MTFFRTRFVPKKPDRRGIAAVEFGLMVALLLPGILAILDIDLAKKVQLKLALAITAAAQYAYLNGESAASASTLSTLVTNVESVLAASNLSLSSESVTFNQTNDYDNYYCISNTSLIWTSTGTASTTCSDPSGVTSGQFIVISAATSYSPISPLDRAIMGSTLSISDKAVVRIR
jgi:type II secretory pathway pseudopilin PulG